MSEEWELAYSINGQIDEFESLREVFPALIMKARETHQTSMGEILLGDELINSFGLSLPLRSRYVVLEKSRVVLEYNVFYQDPIEDKTRVIFQFYVIKKGDDFVIVRRPDDTDYFAMFNNNIEKNILAEYQKALLSSTAFAQLPVWIESL